MKKILFIFAAACAIVFSSCVKDSSCQAINPASEETKIKDFATIHSITATKHPSGLFYQILDSGSAVKPTLTSKVFTTYTGRHLDYSIIEQHTTPLVFQLNSVIPGWQIGLPLIGKGGHILLIIPSALAYACSGLGAVGQNEILYFDITITDIQ